MTSNYPPGFVSYAKYLGKRPEDVEPGFSADFVRWIGAMFGEWTKASPPAPSGRNTPTLADGGPVSPDRVLGCGERGREMFVPNGFRAALIQRDADSARAANRELREALAAILPLAGRAALTPHDEAAVTRATRALTLGGLM